MSKLIPEIIEFDNKYPASHLKTKYCLFLVKILQKSAVKHSVEKSILLNFVRLHTTFCPRLQVFQIFLQQGSHGSKLLSRT